MKIRKAIWLMAILILPIFPARTQHFDWVKTYTGPDLNGSETNNIVGSFVDAEGNFYFLGEFSPSATLCGVRLLPEEVVSEQYKSVVVAKLSPFGQLMWHKAIYGPQNSSAYSLCPMGDTAFMVMVGFKMSHNFNSFLYYLDTLLTSSDAGYLQSCDSTASPLTNGFITFRLDGSVAEQHFLELGYIDSSGRPLTVGLYGQPTPAPDALKASVLSSETFAIDDDGNIYIARLTKDYMYIYNERFSIDDGTIAAFKIMVDGSRPLLYHLEQPSALWNQQILKFSPHFDNLNTATYILDSTWNYGSDTYTSIKRMGLDQNGNIYVTLSGSFMPSSPMYIINSENLYLTYETQLNCILRYTPELSVTALANFNRGTEDPITFGINKLVIDSTQNKIFFSGQAYWGPRNINITYNGDTLEINNGSAYWICLDLNDLSLISYGQANAFDPSESRINSTSTATAYNNRVFMNIKYQHSVSFADTILATNGMPDGFALAIWDYEGHEIEIIDFNSFAYYSHGNQTHIKDSIVYFDGTIYSNADFGTIHIPSSGGSQAFIAKYIDTNFLSPYIYSETRINQIIEWTQPLAFSISDERILLTAVSTSGLPITYTIEDTTIAIIRNDTLILLSEGVTHITASQPGNSAFYPAEPVTRLLQVGRESVDVSNESKIHIYPNPAKDVLYFVCDETTISEITVLSSDGRMTKLPYNSNSIDISTLSTGIYYLVIVSEHEVYKHKIVKL